MPQIPDNSESAIFLTAAIDGIGGAIKTCNEDFIVEEIPLYEPCGDGTHVYAQIEKSGIATMEALGQIATALHIPRKDIGYAGLKDARAVTRQWISIEHIDPDQLKALDLPRMKFVAFSRHTNKLKLGHLSRNRFTVRIRETIQPPQQALSNVESMIDILARRGVPNYFGSQRFGARGETHLLGRAVAKGDIDALVDGFLGHPNPVETDTFTAARRFYEQGDFKKAYRTWPYAYGNQRRALKALMMNKGNKKKAYHVIDKHLKGFFVSAFQSHIFNQVLTARMPEIDKLLTGDMAYKHANGACFHVEDAAVEQGRCDAFDISPTGPLPGFAMKPLTHAAGAIENPILDQAGLTDRDYRQMRQHGAKGGRRPLRFALYDPSASTGTDAHGPYLELRFALDSGCYATSLLRELCKTDLS